MFRADKRHIAFREVVPQGRVAVRKALEEISQRTERFRACGAEGIEGGIILGVEKLGIEAIGCECRRG